MVRALVWWFSPLLNKSNGLRGRGSFPIFNSYSFSLNSSLSSVHPTYNALGYISDILLVCGGSGLFLPDLLSRLSQDCDYEDENSPVGMEAPLLEGTHSDFLHVRSC